MAEGNESGDAPGPAFVFFPCSNDNDDDDRVDPPLRCRIMGTASTVPIPSLPAGDPLVSPSASADDAPAVRSLWTVKVVPLPPKLNRTRELADGDMARAKAKLNMDPGVLGNA